MVHEAPERFNRFMSYLEVDPDNLALIGEAAEAALEAGKPDQALTLLRRLTRRAQLSLAQRNTMGLALMKTGKFAEAADIFGAMKAAGVRESEVAFNLAWSLSMLGHHAEALAELQSGAGDDLAEAATLEVQLHHQLADFEAARERAEFYEAKYPDHEGLMAAISVLAIDLQALDWADACARKANGHPDALASLGTIALARDDVAGALELFRQSSNIRTHNPRAIIGVGLAHMIEGDAIRAADNLDKGADLFGNHLGSWIAAGWAYLILGDYDTARARFLHALELDKNFSESHGSLAVLEAIAGDIERAKKGVRTALRLERHCFSAALAQSLIAASQGNEEVAREIFDRALYTPIDGDGRTVAQSIARLGLNS